MADCFYNCGLFICYFRCFLDIGESMNENKDCKNCKGCPESSGSSLADLLTAVIAFILVALIVKSFIGHFL